MTEKEMTEKTFCPSRFPWTIALETDEGLKAGDVFTVRDAEGLVIHVEFACHPSARSNALLFQRAPRLWLSLIELRNVVAYMIEVFKAHGMEVTLSQGEMRARGFAPGFLQRCDESLIGLGVEHRQNAPVEPKSMLYSPDGRVM